MSSIMLHFTLLFIDSQLNLYVDQNNGFLVGSAAIVGSTLGWE